MEKFSYRKGDFASFKSDVVSMLSHDHFYSGINYTAGSRFPGCPDLILPDLFPCELEGISNFKFTINTSKTKLKRLSLLTLRYKGFTKYMKIYE